MSTLATWPEKKITNETLVYNISMTSAYKTWSPAVWGKWIKFNREQIHMQLFDNEMATEVDIDDQKQYTSEGKPNISTDSTNPYPSLHFKIQFNNVKPYFISCDSD